MPPRPPHRLLGAVLGLLGAVALTAQVDTSAVRLPSPTGPYSVGVSDFVWTDTGQPEPATPDPNDVRLYAASVYYPAVVDPGSAPRAYFPELAELERALFAQGSSGPRDLASYTDRLAVTQTSAYADVPPDTSGGPYPVVLFSVGGDMSRHYHAALAQEFASRGYVIAVVGHPHSGHDVYPDLGLLSRAAYYDEDDERLSRALSERLSGDVAFVADRLLGGDVALGGHTADALVDADRLAVVGHSRGARAVNQLLASDARFTTGVRLDGLGPPVGDSLALPRPHLTIRVPWPQWPERRADLRGLHDRSRAPSYELILDGYTHFSFSDLVWVAPERFPVAGDPAQMHRRYTSLLGDYLEAVWAGRGGGEGAVNRAHLRTADSLIVHEVVRE